MKTAVRNFENTNKKLARTLGATLIEYALLIAILAVTCILVVGSTGGSINKKYSEISSHLAR